MVVEFNLTVVTHTRLHNPYPELLERCKQSVAAALPSNSQHIVVFNDSTGMHRDSAQFAEFYANLRYSALQYSQYIAFVDDDDYIHPDSLRTCMDAISQTGTAVAVTNEIMVDVDGKYLSAYRYPRYYCGVANHPRTVHHLTVFNRDFVQPVALELALQFGAGIEWTMRASACLTGGAVHVPIDGYYWTQHKHRSTTMSTTQHLYADKILPLGNAIKNAFPTRFGRIPTV